MFLYFNGCSHTKGSILKDRLNNAWRYYRMALGIDGYDPEYGRQSVFDFAPNRKVYETALFHQRRTTTE